MTKRPTRFLLPATLATAAFASLSLLTGCGSGIAANLVAATPDRASVNITGTVHGGQSPISASLVQLWETGGGTAGATATATATLGTGTSAGKITTITLTGAGSGYTTAPTVTITDPNGSGATATATLSATDGTIASVTLTAAGSGYTAPVVVFTGGIASNGYGKASVQLIASTTSAVGNGGFSFPAANVPANCKTGPFTYITASGGDPTALTSTSTNSAILMLAMVGNCSTTGSSTNVIVNEVTTVAAAYALANFATDSSATVSIGAPLTNSQGLADAVANAALLVNQGSGVTNTSSAAVLLPTALVNTLGNSLAACVNTVSSATTLSTGCSNLFTYTTPPGTSTAVPADTFQAALNMAKYPGNNVVSIMNLGNAQAAFAPALATAVATNTTNANDLSMTIGFANNTLNGASTTGIGLAIDSADNVILGGSYAGTAGSYSEYLAILTSPSAGAAETLSLLPSTIGYATPQDAAVDANNTIWLTDSSGGDLIKIPNETASSATQVLVSSPDNTSPSLTGTANTAEVAQNTYGVAIDGSNNIWTSTYRSQGNCVTPTMGTTPAANSICDIQELVSGTASTFTTTFGSTTASEYDFTERNLTVDSSSTSTNSNPNSTKGNIWLPNYGGTSAGGSVGTVEIFNPGSSTVPATSVNVTVSNSSTNTYGSGPYAVALDATGSGWVTAYYAGTGTNADYLFYIPYNATSSTTPAAAVSYSPTGINSTSSAPATTTSPAATTAFTVGGLSTPRSVAIDGAGNVFVANYGAKALVEYSPSFAHSSTTGAYLSPYYGFAPTLAVPAFVYSYSITSANLVTFNTPNNLYAGESVVLAGFTSALGKYMNGQTVSVTSATAYAFKATPTGGTSTTVATTTDSGTATPTTLNPVTFTCTNSSTTNTCTLPGAFTILGPVAIDKAGSVWTVGSNGTLFEMLGTAAPTDPLLSDGKYGVKP